MKNRAAKNLDRNRAVTGRERLPQSYMIFNGVAWPRGPPMLMKNLDRNRAVTGRERLPQSYMIFNGVAWPCGPPMLMKNLDRNRAVTGRERLPQSYMFFRGAEITRDLIDRLLNGASARMRNGQPRSALPR